MDNAGYKSTVTETTTNGTKLLKKKNIASNDINVASREHDSIVQDIVTEMERK